VQAGGRRFKFRLLQLALVSWQMQASRLACCKCCEKNVQFAKEARSEGLLLAVGGGSGHSDCVEH
jgi:hypothetical protein